MADLIYVHDPMCSWCWAFRPVWLRLQADLPEEIRVVRLLGGLAPDSDEPMPDDLQRAISSTWRKIEQQVPGTEFNHAFWTQASPRRSTYPACRAVIAARTQNAEIEMIEALQQAYYLRAMNPSDVDTHLQLAGELGLDVDRFESEVLAPETQEVLMEEISAARSIGGNSFPSLFLRQQGKVTPVRLDYLNAQTMLDTILKITR